MSPMGVVTGSEIASIFADPNSSSEVLGHVSKDAKIVIDLGKSTENHLYICTVTGLEGYIPKHNIRVIEV